MCSSDLVLRPPAAGSGALGGGLVAGAAPEVGAVGVVALPVPAIGALLPGVWPAGGAPGVGCAVGG